MKKNTKRSIMKVELDIFDLMFLVEGVIPPRPIARSMLFDRYINEFYGLMNDDQRKKMHEFVIKQPSFSLENEQCQWFEARYNHENQYDVFTNYLGKEETHKAFKNPYIKVLDRKDGVEELFYTGQEQYIAPEYIVKTEKLKL